MVAGSERTPDEQRFRFDPVGAVRKYGLAAGRIAAGVALLTAIISGIYFLFLQEVRQASVLEFRPTFLGIDSGQYPNGLPFSPSDVAAGPVVDLVFDANNIADYCPREAFRGGFFVEQRSDQSAFLDAEYQARLSDLRISAVERQRLQAEYESKRAALPVQFRLVFVKPRQCSAIPQVIVSKVIADVLTTWASESESKRGVLNHNVEVLTPAMLDVGVDQQSSKLLRADLIRTALWRIVESVDKVEDVPGAALVRYGEGRLTFMEVRNKLVDLVRSRLEPLVAIAGQTMVRESVAWVTETVAAAEREQQAAEGRAAANREALQLYSGMSQTPGPARSGTQTTPTGSDVQTISPQIDSTFIDRIVEMSSANTLFRQQLTESMVQATVEAVAAQERAAYYRRLLETLRGPASQQLTGEEVDARLAAIVEQGQHLTRQFNELYSEFSRVGLRTAGAMYQTEKPVATEVSRSFGLRGLIFLVASMFVMALLLALAFFVGRDILRAEPRTR
jgi:hypothetical protein